MLITRLALKNWRNFKAVDVSLRERVFVIGPNASGKSNLLDVLRFLRDVAKPGGGLQRAVAERGGLTKLRCLQARRDPEVSITVELADRVDQPAVWRYTLAFKSEGKGLQRVVVSKELAIDLRQNIERMSRPDKLDAADKERLAALVNPVRRSRKKRLVAELVPANGSRVSIGPLYNELLCEFVRTTWNLEAVCCNAPSLAKALVRLRSFL